jgi:hypothetical protein
MLRVSQTLIGKGEPFMEHIFWAGLGGLAVGMLFNISRRMDELCRIIGVIEVNTRKF